MCSSLILFLDPSYLVLPLPLQRCAVSKWHMMRTFIRHDVSTVRSLNATSFPVLSVTANSLCVTQFLFLHGTLVSELVGLMGGRALLRLGVFGTPKCLIKIALGRASTGKFFPHLFAYLFTNGTLLSFYIKNSRHEGMLEFQHACPCL